MLEQRRLQKLGQSTLMVSLPKHWVDQMNLKQGDIVSITADEQGRLVIHPSLQMLPTKTRCIIKVEKVDDKFLNRLILAAYIVGHETFELNAGRDGFTPSQLEVIRKALGELIGVGIVDQGIKRIVIQSFLDPSKFPIEGLISRLHLIVESMVDLAINSLIEERNELAKQVLDMDVEADKVYFLATRQLIQAVEDKGLAEKVGLENPKNILGDRLVIKALEEIGDYAEVIARSAIKINDLRYYNKSIMDYILLLREHVKKVGSLAINSFFKRDAQSANAAMKEYDHLIEVEEVASASIDKALASVTATLATELMTITQTIRQVGRYYMIVSESMINRAVEGSSEIAETVKVSETELIQYKSSKQ